MDRALVVGINTYAEQPLRGCVNDATAVASYLVARAGFAEGQVRMLVDRRATRAALVERLEWLCAGARAGDRLLFHFSGHGVQLAKRDARGEIVGLDDAICPFDFEWSGERALRDDDFAALFACVPASASFTWISDSCHSGDLAREAGPAQSRRLAPPADVAWRVGVAQRAAERGGLRRTRLGASTARHEHVVLLAACQSDETAADAAFAEGYGGAFTHALLAELDRPGQRDALLPTLMQRVHDAVAATFHQHPRLEGHGVARRGAFLATPGRGQAASSDTTMQGSEP